LKERRLINGSPVRFGNLGPAFRIAGEHAPWQRQLSAGARVPTVLT
jgi:hypothetical protein